MNVLTRCPNACDVSQRSTRKSQAKHKRSRYETDYARAEAKLSTLGPFSKRRRVALREREGSHGEA